MMKKEFENRKEQDGFGDQTPTEKIDPPLAALRGQEDKRRARIPGGKRLENRCCRSGNRY